MKDNDDSSQGMAYLDTVGSRTVTVYLPLFIFVFVLLFPQLIYALFDPKANRTGSMAAFAVSFVLRVLGEPVEQQRRRTYQVLKWVGLQHRLNALPQELSGGE